MSNMESAEKTTVPKNTNERFQWITLGGFLSLLMFSYWNMFVSAANEWHSNELYSHGYLIPILALVILYMRRQSLRLPTTKERIVGMIFIVASCFLRVFCAAFETLDMYTFITVLVGLFIFVGGLSMLRWAGPVLFLLLFMFPLPHTITKDLLVPMQHFATHASTCCLKIFSFPAFQDGNSISIGSTRIDIIEQCSGLKMTTIFLALSISLVLINEREWWENVIIIFMAIPIALVTNIVRIVVTSALVYAFPTHETLKHLVHDGAGLCMVPLAIALLVLLQYVLSHIFIEDGDESTQLEMIENPQEVFWKDRKKIED